jgi:hypothetical protein
VVQPPDSIVPYIICALKGRWKTSVIPAGMQSLFESPKPVVAPPANVRHPFGMFPSRRNISEHKAEAQTLKTRTKAMRPYMLLRASGI